MIEQTVKPALEQISLATSLKQLEELKIHFLGKNGLIASEMQKMQNLDAEAKKEFGKTVNEAKHNISSAIDTKYAQLKKAYMYEQLKSEAVDMSLPPRSSMLGSVHPLSQATQELLEIFVRLGFTVKEGRSIEDDWHNFGALNFPDNHPARQMQDTFYLQGDSLLRTHTSSVQIREMKASKPPFRFVSHGRVYRSESDMTHTPMFHQIEILMIDKDIHMGHLKYLLHESIKQFFEQDEIEMRFRPSFFPFTEPSAEVDIKMKGSDKWLEILGCGMVHPNVLKNVNIAEGYQGFAAGMGVERMAMLKYGIEDLRQMFDGDKRWLDHYSFSAFDIPSFAWGLTR